MRSTIHSRRHAIHPLPVALVASLSIAPSLWADTIRVPQDHKTIQAAIDAATSGDTVVVSAGTYRERISFETRHHRKE